MGTSFPFHLNILWNNVADLVVIVYMVLSSMPWIVFIPTIFMAVIFYNIQKFYRVKLHALNDMSKFYIYRELEVVTNTVKGK